MKFKVLHTNPETDSVYFSPVGPVMGSYIRFFFFFPSKYFYEHFRHGADLFLLGLVVFAKVTIFKLEQMWRIKLFFFPPGRKAISDCFM